MRDSLILEVFCVKDQKGRASALSVSVMSA